MSLDFSQSYDIYGTALLPSVYAPGLRFHKYHKLNGATKNIKINQPFQIKKPYISIT